MPSALRFLLAEFINPLILDAGNFRSLYAVLSCIFALTALSLRWCWRGARESNTASTTLNEYEIAYLAGGKKRAIRTVIVSLAKRGYLHVFPSTGAIQVAKPLLYTDRPLEKAVVEVLSFPHGEAVEREIKAIAQNLGDIGLIFQEDQKQLVRRWLSVFPLFGLVVLGFCRIVVNSLDQQPAIAILWSLVAIAACFSLFKPHRTRSGDRLLHQLRSRHAKLKEVEALDRLKSKGAKHFTNLNVDAKSQQLTLAFALFGEDVLSS